MDLGSHYMKIGFSGEGYPRFIIPSVIGYKTYPPDPKEVPLTAYDALYEKNVHLVYPFQEKTISERAEWDWYSAKEMISSSIRQLKIDPEEYNVLYIEPQHSNKKNVERLYKLIKDKFRFKEMFTFNQALLTVQEMKKTSAIVFELGHNISSVIAYYKGFQISESLRFFTIAGRLISEEFAKLLEEQLRFGKVTTYECVRLIEKYFYVPKDYEQEQENYDRGYIKDIEALLPFSNRRVTIGDERFRLPETLFNPSLVLDKEIEGLMKIVEEVILECPIDTRAEILNNIILSGGLSKLKSLDERLISELKKLYPNLELRIISHPRRELTSWIAADNLCREGVPTKKTKVVTSLDVNFKIPDLRIEQLYQETIRCYKANLHLATIILAIQTIETLIKSLIKTDVPLLSVFTALKEEGIIDEKFYNWANTISFIRNPSSKNIVQNATKDEALNIVEFLKKFLEITYLGENTKK